MANEATIVAASLDSSELQNSINQLVKNFDSKLGQMMKDTDVAVSTIEQTFKRLSKVSFDSNGASTDNGASRRARKSEQATQAVQKENEANKQLNLTLDQQAQMMQKVAQSSQKMSESAMNNLVDNAFKNNTRLYYARTMKIDDSQYDLAITKLERLQSIMADTRMRGVLSPSQIATTEQEVRRLEQSLRNVSQEQQRGVQATRQQAQEQFQVIESVQRGIQAYKDYREVIRNAAADIRSRMYATETNYAVFSTNSNITSKDYSAIIYKENDARANGLTIEEQILNVIRQKHEAEKNFAATQGQVTQELTKQAELAEKTKKAYVSPMDRISVDDYNLKKYSDYISSKTKRQPENVSDWTSERSSISRLTEALKVYQEAYRNMTSLERAHPYGKITVQNINELQRTIQKLQSQLNRPVDFDSVMGIKPKTLDDIAYKIRQLQAYKMGVDITKLNAANELQKVDSEINKLNKDMQKFMGTTRQSNATVNALTRSLNYMKNRLAFYFTVGAATTFVKQLVQIRGQYELLERSIGILYDSMQQGSKIFAELNAMAIKSPFTTMELGAAAKQLSAYNIAAKDVVDTTRRLADIAAAVGIPIERLTYALGQIKSYGYLNSRDARMFANAGIPLIQNLAEMYTKLEGRLVSIGDVYDRIKKKQISFEDTLKVVNEMTNEGGRFFNFQEKAADTLVVKLANLNLAWNNMLNEVGKSNTGLLNTSITGLKVLFENWRKMENAVLSLVSAYGLAKTAQIVYIALTQKVGLATAFANVVSMRFLKTLGGLRAAFTAGISAAGGVAAAVGAITAVLGYLLWQWWDLSKANDALQKSMSDNADENIRSIDKFFSQYKKDIEEVNYMKADDQQRMWEKIRDEIEKTSRNAQQYIDLLEKIPDVAERVAKSSEVLEHEKVIQSEAQRLSKLGVFDMGGGFADDSLAEDLKEYDKYLNGIIKDYGSVAKAEEELERDFIVYKASLTEANKELDSFIESLSKADIRKIAGKGDLATMTANVRDYANYVRDTFLSTEEGQKVSIEGQALLNARIDQWIAGLFEAKTEAGKLRLEAEANRTAWEAFFSNMSEESKKSMDYLVKSGQVGSEEFKTLWNNAAKELEEKNNTLYQSIKDKIEDLRHTAPIVIDIIYRETKQTLDAQQQAFEERWITPKNWLTRNLSSEQFMKEETENRTKYGRLMRKQDEDNVEWEKRLGQEYVDNEKKVKSLNNQLKKNANLSDADRTKKEEEIKLYQDLNAAIKEIGDAQGFDYDQFEKGKKKNKKNQKDEVLDALKQEIDLVKKLQGEYDKLVKSGAAIPDALESVGSAFGNTIKFLNAKLQGFNIPQIDLKTVLTGDPNKTLAYFENLRRDLEGKGLLNLERSKALEVVIEEFKVKAKTYNLDMITKGLNNELGKLKDEYELAIALDADPEMGGIFADMFDIHMENLPRTAEQYAKGITDALNTYLKKMGSDLNISNILNITKDDLNEFQKQVESGTFNQTWVNKIREAYKAAKDAREKEFKDTQKSWSDLVKKYGDLQSKLISITKEGLKEQVSIIKKFGTDEEKTAAINLLDMIAVESDPQKIAELQKQLAPILQNVVQGSPTAKKVLTSSQNQTAQESSKAYWDDFKNSDLYTMTFEDMANNSTMAIQMIIDKLDNLKDKVKEDPASMKALVKSIEDAEKEMIQRDPLGSIIRNLKKYKESAKEVKDARQTLAATTSLVESAQQKLNAAKEKGDPKEIAKEEMNVAVAEKAQEQATTNLAKAQNKQKKSLKEIGDSLEATQQQMQAAQTTFNSLAEAFRAFGDEDTADMLGEIANGFAMIIPVVVAVTVAINTLEKSSLILLAISAALATIIGLISFFSGQSDKKITKAVEESERAVQKLENRVESLKGAYDRLTDAAEHSYGAQSAAATLASYSIQEQEIALKRLQLAETRRQLKLEQQRDSKKRDEDKILSLQKDIISQENEIDSMLRETNRAVEEVVDSLLGLSRGSWAEELTDALLTAFKAGEDYMDVFEESWDEMVQNMVVKTIAARLIGDAMQTLVFDKIDDIVKSHTDNYRQELSNLETHKANLRSLRMENQQQWLATISQYPEFARALENISGEGRELAQIYSRVFGGTASNDDLSRYYTGLINGEVDRFFETYGNAIENAMSMVYDQYGNSIQSSLDAAQQKAQEDALRYVLTGEEGERTKNELKDALSFLPDFAAQWGIEFGQDAEKALSALQQGIQGITEDQAGAIEAYMNIISQRMFYHGTLLEEIRDAVVTTDNDIQESIQAQMLLQLQQSYQVQMTIKNILVSVLNPSERAFMVELIS